MSSLLKRVTRRLVVNKIASIQRMELAIRAEMTAREVAQRAAPYVHAGWVWGLCFSLSMSAPASWVAGVARDA